MPVAGSRFHRQPDVEEVAVVEDVAVAHAPVGARVEIRVDGVVLAHDDAVGIFHALFQGRLDLLGTDTPLPEWVRTTLWAIEFAHPESVQDMAALAAGYRPFRRFVAFADNLVHMFQEAGLLGV